MGFHCQIRLDEIPRSEQNQSPLFLRDGLLQVFACPELCGCDPFEGYYLTRIVRPNSNQSLKELVAANVKKSGLYTDNTTLSSDARDLIEKSSGNVWGKGRLGEYPDGYDQEAFPLRFVKGWKEGDAETPSHMVGIMYRVL